MIAVMATILFVSISRNVLVTATSFIGTRLFYRPPCGWINFYIVNAYYIADMLTRIGRHIVCARRIRVFECMPITIAALQNVSDRYAL